MLMPMAARLRKPCFVGWPPRYNVGGTSPKSLTPRSVSLRPIRCLVSLGAGRALGRSSAAEDIIPTRSAKAQTALAACFSLSMARRSLRAGMSVSRPRFQGCFAHRAIDPPRLHLTDESSSTLDKHFATRAAFCPEGVLVTEPILFKTRD